MKIYFRTAANEILNDGPSAGQLNRLNAEWIALNAFRGLVKIAARGAISKSTYAESLALGGALYPELLGEDSSILRREFESKTTKEFKQRAQLTSSLLKEPVSALTLVREEIQKIKELLKNAKGHKNEERNYRQLKIKFAELLESEEELDVKSHSEHQLIFRDAYNVVRHVPSPRAGYRYKDYDMGDGRILRMRVLHPDKPEHISGADIIYERYNINCTKVSIAAVQYKIWEGRQLAYSDPRMLAQIHRLKQFICSNNLCSHGSPNKPYRFPCCAAFIRPTDKLQNPNQRFMSSGEHLPICHIENCLTTGERGGRVLSYKEMKGTSISSEMFEHLFNDEKIGSRLLELAELQAFYENYLPEAEAFKVIIYAQEFSDGDTQPSQ